jgi:broad specificity phosphatase PhoE
MVAKLLEPVEISHIFCSDRLRATTTAEEIGKSAKLPIHRSESLRALDVGDFSGKLRTKESEAALQVFIDHPSTDIPGGESLNNFKSRIRPCITEAVDIALKCGVPTIVVAHSSIVHEVGSMLYNDHKSILVEPGGIVAIYLNNGKVVADPIFRPTNTPPGTRSETIS